MGGNLSDFETEAYENHDDDEQSDHQTFAAESQFIQCFLPFFEPSQGVLHTFDLFGDEFGVFAQGEFVTQNLEFNLRVHRLIDVQ